MLCRHCQRVRSCRPRGLCWCCYYKPGVREQYPTHLKFSKRGEGNFYRDAPLHEFPTSALPGSDEKIAVLAERVRLKQCLWHPDDATMEGGPMPIPKAG